MNHKVVNIFIVDDHQLFIDGLKAILRTAREVQVSGSAGDGEEALRLIDGRLVDLVITDISMPNMSGDVFTRLLKEKHPSLKVLVLSMHNDIEHINRMLTAGADGYILKNTGRKELLEAVREIMNGRQFFSVEVKNQMLNAYVGKSRSEKTKEKKPVDTESLYFTRREKEVMRLIKEGLTSQDIAFRLYLSVNTVNTHRKNIYAKTNVSNAAQLIDFIEKNNINL